MDNNDCKFIGRITKDLELRESTNGTKHLLFDIAVQRKFKNNEDEYESDFINCIAFNKTAEFINNYAKKGYLIGVEGEIQNNNHERQDGTINYGTQLKVNKVNSQILFLNKEKSTNSTNQSDNVQSGQRNKKNQGSYQPSSNNPFSNANGPIDINDDDLPF
ncbi:single-stranded DNA-binding protein [Mammaliicoccus sciuri]|uniref:single-stranded DNA-binding protein n=1 Tax=Mammaliicoccus sciuri TaxID=1296 RepID=UPI0019D37685|nr:single-stranded DNA-binding protein [Mammaliicoccus sciuri]MEB8072198.1 single-stranded DNA-binding protein [Mammaliicoccus sciuri]QSN67043.1 single-stranded DNA-binding protein [Mammaliicoccus sciuri]UIU21766.1 single-stranded DNA-binding protein [Mammaliicoccus sciuri]UIU24666.1 single-stranded DNA-binding protein [Mammaliicoccus sciuri]